MPKIVNLNKLLTDTDRRKQVICGDIKLLFDTNNILTSLVRRINKDDTHFVMGCAAWFTNDRIITALSKLKGGVGYLYQRQSGACQIFQDKVSKTPKTWRYTYNFNTWVWTRTQCLPDAP